LNPDRETISIKKIKWSYYGTEGVCPDLSKNYAGLIVYHPGTFKWERSIYPGYALVREYKNMNFTDIFKEIFGISEEVWT
jgi:hypothetical protein